MRSSITPCGERGKALSAAHEDTGLIGNELKASIMHYHGASGTVTSARCLGACRDYPAILGTFVKALRGFPWIRVTAKAHELDNRRAVLI